MALADSTPLSTGNPTYTSQVEYTLFKTIHIYTGIYCHFTTAQLIDGYLSNVSGAFTRNIFIQIPNTHFILFDTSQTIKTSINFFIR